MTDDSTSAAATCRACNGRGVWVTEEGSVEACADCLGLPPPGAPLPEGQPLSPPVSRAPLVASLAAENRRLRARNAALAKRLTQAVRTRKLLIRRWRQRHFTRDDRRVFACLMGCVGVPTAALEAGVVQDAAAALRWFAGLARAGGLKMRPTPEEAELDDAQAAVMAQLRRLAGLGQVIECAAAGGRLAPDVLALRGPIPNLPGVPAPSTPGSAGELPHAVRLALQLAREVVALTRQQQGRDASADPALCLCPMCQLEAALARCPA